MMIDLVECSPSSVVQAVVQLFFSTGLSCAMELTTVMAVSMRPSLCVKVKAYYVSLYRQSK